MGCDIHLTIEVKNTNEHRSPGYDWMDHPLQSPTGLGSRNYGFFSVLADVRNGGSYASDKNRVRPISAPRGTPKDASFSSKWDSDEWKGDGHSHSWVLLSELYNYDWAKTHVIHGIVSLATYKHCKETGENPTMWCGGTTAEVVSEKKADELLAAGEEPGEEFGGKYSVSYSWGVTMDDKVGWADHVKPICDALLLGGKFKPEEVRLVFFFDN